ncbi:SAF domain-containing protein [Paenibacillus sp. HB172176]|uniref:SAF domain-containing protein n=1 Tax=Paenibacillus sp. HB172176 TaxID=2493690 RepID=UPI00143A852B|nr:SAF domain-containing protein [Paenibacillus sp. HB172176]
MNIWKKMNRIVLYAALIIATLAALYLLDTRWSTAWDTAQVVTASRQIMPHETIEDADLAIVEMKKELIIPGALSPDQLPALIGQEALQLIETGDQFTMNRVDKQSLLKSPDMHIVEIPDKWILSVPGSLRRLDAITIYAVQTAEGANAAVNPETGTDTELDSATLSPPPISKVMEDVVIAYYKDAGVNEVRSAITEGSNPNIRDTATVRGRRLELQLNDEQLKELSSLVDQGYQFMIGYGG